MPKFVTPKAGEGFVNLRSAPRVHPDTLVGGLGQEMRLELLEEGDAFHICKVFISTQVAEVGNLGRVGLRAGFVRGNIRRVPNVDDPATDIGDLGPRQSLEFVEFVPPEWLVSRVYVSAEDTRVVADGDSTPTHEVPVADGFDAPVGTVAERRSNQVWPGGWFDATGYAERYWREDRNMFEYHTGADLNLPGDVDQLAPCYAPAGGVVRAAEAFPVWGNVIVIEHRLRDGTRVWSRLGHLDSMLVRKDDEVKRGQLVGRIGNAFATLRYHLHYDVARINLGVKPEDWPGGDEQRVRRDYINPQKFTQDNRPSPERPIRLQVGLHDEQAADWMKRNGLRGVCLAHVTVQQQALQLDYSALANAGITVLLRIGYGYADGTGTLPPPARLEAFEQAVFETLKNAKGVEAAHYGNEINNPSEHPGWGSNSASDYFRLTPEYYVASYNRVWSRLPENVKMGPAPLDPYFGPGSNNGDWWRSILNNIKGAEAIFLHSKTQTNDHTEVRSTAHFTDDPLRWQYLHFRTIETGLADVPSRFKHLPVYISEANPQRTQNGLGWEADNAEWVTQCIDYVREWNAGANHQPISGVVFYRWQDDQWALKNKASILGRILQEAQ